MTRKVEEKVSRPNTRLYIKARVRLLANAGKIAAVANISINDAFAIKGIRITEGSRGLFISMPSTSFENNKGETEYREMAFPITKEARDQMTATIMAAYHQAIADVQMRAVKMNQLQEDAVEMQMM